MKTYEILSNSSAEQAYPKIQHYLHNRIDQIGQDFKNIERCEVVLQKNAMNHGECEVKVRLFVPRFMYSSYKTGGDFMIAVKTAFDDLNEQMNELKERMYDKVLFSNAKA